MAKSPRWLPVSCVEKYVPLARTRGVSKVARSSRGFWPAYRRAGSRRGLDPWWRRRRDGFVARHRAQQIKRGEPLYKPDGTPTDRHLAEIMWAYSPDPNVCRRR